MEKHWWEESNFSWRMVQTNLRQTDLKDFDTKKFISDILNFNANVVLFNATGIITNYFSELDSVVINPYLKKDILSELLEMAHKNNIHIIARTDFSKIRLAIYHKHPDWAYRDKNNNIVNYNGDIHACINSNYQQKYMFTMLQEMINKYDFDGVFFNMPGFITNDYSGIYHGICHCENCKRKFKEYCGSDLPEERNDNNEVYKKYLNFQQKCIEELNQKIKLFIRKQKKDMAINDVDIVRRESNTEIDRPLPLWQYSASSNARSVQMMDKKMQVTNTAVDFMGFKQRNISSGINLNRLRMWQNLANGSGLDYYIIGRLDNHIDKTSDNAVKEIFAFEKKYQSKYKNITSMSKVLVLTNPTWAHQNEIKGFIRILTESHIPFDECPYKYIRDMTKYEVVIIPDIKYINDDCLKMIDSFVKNKGIVIASGESANQNENHEKLQTSLLQCLGIKNIDCNKDNMISSMILNQDKTYTALYKNYIYAEYYDTCKMYGKLIPPQPLGPPERCYTNEITNLPGFTENQYGNGKAIYIPWYPGTFFYKEGYENTKAFVDNILFNICRLESVSKSLTPMIEVTVGKRNKDIIIQLINNSGHFGNSYYKPLPVNNIELSWNISQKISSVRSLVLDKNIEYNLSNGKIQLFLPKLYEYDMIEIIIN